MANPEKPKTRIELQYPDLILFKLQIERDQFPFKEIARILDDLLEEPEIRNHPLNEIYQELITLDMMNLYEIEKKGKGQTLSTISPSDPYQKTKETERLLILGLHILNKEPESEEEGRFIIADKVFSALRIALPEGWQTLQGFLTAVDRNVQSNRINLGFKNRVNWTFPTRILGVAVDVEHIYPKPQALPLTERTFFQLAFKEEVFSKQ